MSARQKLTLRFTGLELPPVGRGEFIAVGLAELAAFSLLGLFASLAPTFLSDVLHEQSYALSGTVVFLIFGTAAIAQLALAGVHSRSLVFMGLGLLPLALTAIDGGLAGGSVPLFLLGTIIGGVAVGAVFMGGLATANRLAPAALRSKIVSTYFVFAYVGLSIPVIGVGIASDYIGDVPAVLVCSTVLAVICAFSIQTIRRASSRQPPRAAGVSHVVRSRSKEHLACMTAGGPQGVDHRCSMEQMKRIERTAPDNTGSAVLRASDTQGSLVTQEQLRPSPAADAETPPPRSAHVALVVSCSLSSQVASRQAHADIAAPTPTDRAERANKWVVLALVGTAAFMTTLDASIVNIGLPSIARSFGVQLSGSIEWVLIGYLVIMAATILTLGRLADMLGRKPVLLAGLAVFVVGSALCGAAPSLGTLIAARCVEGLGGAAIFSINLAMITRSFPATERGRALGINAILVALGVSAGPTVGGVLTQIGTWRWIFYVNVPIGVIVILAAWHLLTERPQLERQRLDLPGAALLAIGLGALTLGLSFGQEWGWDSIRFVAALVIAAAALAGAAWVERRVPAPVLDPALLRNRVFVSANASFIMAMLALFAVGFLLPFYFEELRGYDTLHSGLLLTPLSLTLGVIAPLSGTLADRVGSRWLSPVGLVIAGAGLLLLSGLTQASSTWYLILALIVTGIGQGIFQAPNTRAIMGSAPPGEQGVASGTLSTGRVIGQSLSVAVAGAVFTTLGSSAAGASLEAGRTTLSAAQVQALQQTFVTGLHAAFVVCAVLAAIGVVTALVRGNDSVAPTSFQKQARQR